MNRKQFIDKKVINGSSQIRKAISRVLKWDKFIIPFGFNSMSAHQGQVFINKIRVFWKLNIYYHFPIRVMIWKSYNYDNSATCYLGLHWYCIHILFRTETSTNARFEIPRQDTILSAHTVLFPSMASSCVSCSAGCWEGKRSAVQYRMELSLVPAHNYG